MEKMIMDELMEVLTNTGFYRDEIFRHCGTTPDVEDVEIDAFIEDFFMKKDITVQTDVTDAFDSPGYDCSVLSVAWVLDGNLYLNTFLLESY